MFEADRGVSQGMVVGPLFSDLYVNDIEKTTISRMHFGAIGRQLKNICTLLSPNNALISYSVPCLSSLIFCSKSVEFWDQLKTIIIKREKKKNSKTYV